MLTLGLRPRRRVAAVARESGQRRARQCEDARTPGLVSVDAVVPRASREREIARAITDLDRFVERGAELGRQRHGYGVRSIDFRFGGEALIGALGDVLGESLTADLEHAWRTAYHLVGEVMLGGAAQSNSLGSR